MDRQLIAQLIKRYRSGEATEQEKFQLEEFWRLAQLDDSVLNEFSTDELESLKQRMFAETRMRIQRIQQPAVEQPATIKKQNPWFYKIAATISLTLIASVVFYWYTNKITEIRTGFGERLSVTLPDESTVTLNGNSVLRYKGAWKEDDTREVWIDGEGFFAVTHTKNHQKFIVHASDQLNVEVLGTKFNVKSRAAKSEVMLTEGKVKLDVQDSEGAPVFLKPGELATMTEKKLFKKEVKDTQYTSWLKYTLLFDRTTLGDVAALLHDTYGLDVVFSEPELKNREISGEISSANVNDVLLAISQVFDLKVERNGRHVTISPK